MEIKSTNKYLVKRKYKTINGTTYPMDEYQALLYEEDSEDCGFIRPQYQWSATTGYLCDDETYTKYTREVYMVSYDSGVTWAVVEPVQERRGEVIAYDSYDCGKPMYRCVETNNVLCRDNGDEWKLKVVSNWEPIDSSGNTFDTVIHCDNSTSLTKYETKDTYHKQTQGHGVFDKSITSGDVGTCVTFIGEDAFSGWTALSSLTIANTVTRIAHAFDGCCQLCNTKDNRLVIPRSVTSIGDEAFFKNCTDASGRTINAIHAKVLWEELEEIPDMAFVESGNSTYYTTHYGFQSAIVPYGTLMIYRSKPMITYNYHTYLSWGNFGGLFQEECTEPRDGWKMKATISGTTYYLGGDGTSTLTEFEAKHIRCWDNYTTVNYTKELLAVNRINDIISNIEVADSVTTLDNDVFSYFWGLSSITIPSSVTSIKNNAFKMCNGLETMTCLATTPPVLQSYAALPPSSITTIYVPSASLDDYKTATDWSRYASKMVGI